MLTSGSVMTRYDIASIEKNEAIKQRYWRVYHLVDDSHVRVFVFSYTLLNAQFMDEKHLKDMDMIEHEIRDARFSKEAGVFQ